MADAPPPPSQDDPKETAFFALLDKWADNREANRAKDKTKVEGRNILDALFGNGS